MEAAIRELLRTIEEEEQVRILYACESGSRAWGFASHDSDYDIRFLYVRPRAVYLRLDGPRDVIERPIVNDLDVSGWDIYKALRLLRKSNPPLLEWLFSPIVYLENSPSIQDLRAIAQRHYSPNSLFYHYRHMADGNYRQYILGKSEVILKKYLYVLRPLIALLFLEQQHHLPPTNFLETLGQVQLEEAVLARIHALVARKQVGDELGLEAPDMLLNSFVYEQLDKWAKKSFDGGDQKALSEELERVLALILDEGDNSR
jgi:predicted nucleotidyltransferase